jgi:hypothetical protein
MLIGLGRVASQGVNPDQVWAFIDVMWDPAGAASERGGWVFYDEDNEEHQDKAHYPFLLDQSEMVGPDIHGILRHCDRHLTVRSGISVWGK